MTKEKKSNVFTDQINCVFDFDGCNAIRADQIKEKRLEYPT